MSKSTSKPAVVIPEELHNQYKSLCSLQGVSMIEMTKAIISHTLTIQKEHNISNMIEFLEFCENNQAHSEHMQLMYDAFEEYMAQKVMDEINNDPECNNGGVSFG